MTMIVFWIFVVVLAVVLVVVALWSLFRSFGKEVSEFFDSCRNISRDYKEGRRGEARFQIGLWIISALIVSAGIGLLCLIAR